MARSTLFLIVGGTTAFRSDACYAWIRERHPSLQIVAPALLSCAAELMHQQRGICLMSRACAEVDPLPIARDIRSRGHRLIVIAYCSDTSECIANGTNGVDARSKPAHLFPDLVRQADYAFLFSGDGSRLGRNAFCAGFERGRIITLGRTIPARPADDFYREIAEFLSTRPRAPERSLEDAERIVRSVDLSGTLKTAHSGTFVGVIVGVTSLHVVQRVDYTDSWTNRGNTVYIAHVKLNLPNRPNVGDYLSITHQRNEQSSHVSFKPCRRLGPPEIDDPSVALSLPNNYARSLRAFVAELNRSAAIPGGKAQLTGRLSAALVAGADRCMTDETDIDGPRRALSKWVAQELGRLSSHGDQSPFRDRSLSKVYSSSELASRRSVTIEQPEESARKNSSGIFHAEVPQRLVVSGFSECLAEGRHS